ncbi:MFS general substrate transporter [Coniophora puteana RWD-64-598 SS2]|uniref:MFS general substrate transporter n=1 Tax=Coniophora puteana (strain RWD-64-598) TaxID=741705 RepID=A0A5M3MG89_CONPW|nr:MFS general substrate transporter [Coniophora puteana RWD-64-598 SS2]EIW78232.1 MFS general substrate transporter [Coniophora puteana RWD-64-598 SS2]
MAQNLNAISPALAQTSNNPEDHRPGTATPVTIASPSSQPEVNVDIEHVHVEDDPRTWSNTRKNLVLFIISGAAVISGLTGNIQNPANAQIQQQLHASAQDISLSLSMFILIQGSAPLFWTALSEIKGRKLVYLVSITIFIITTAIVAISKTIGMMIGMRVLQAAGSSPFISVGAATLADIYEPHQRGTMMGIYYSAPLLGPALGPIVGGALTQGFGWRAVFWFLCIWGGVIFAAFAFLFKDTFRKERSLTYQNVLKRRIRERQQHEQQKARKSGSGDVTPATARPSIEHEHANEKTSGTEQGSPKELEAQKVVVSAEAMKEIKPSLADINPFPPYWRVIRRKNNLVIITSSGLLFAFGYSIAYTCARTLADSYGYNAMTTGLVLLTFGVGMTILGGRWSDRALARRKAANGGVSYAEMRLDGTKIVMLFFPPSVIGYAWVCQEHVHIAAVCVMLFLCGFFVIWIYSSTLSYVVDANVGRSSSAVASNSLFRGVFAFVAAEVAIPLQDAIGDGGLYTLWAGLMLLSQGMTLLVIYKGREWREQSIEAEKARQERKDGVGQA